MTDKITLMRHRIVFTRSMSDDLECFKEQPVTIENFRLQAVQQLLAEWNEAAYGDDVVAVLRLEHAVTLLQGHEYRIEGVAYLPASEDRPAALVQTFYDNYGISGEFVFPDLVLKGAVVDGPCPHDGGDRDDCDICQGVGIWGGMPEDGP